MDISKEKRLELYRKASEEVQTLYGSVDTGRILRKAEDTLGLNTEEQRTIFALAVGDVILGMYKKESLPQLFTDRLKLSSPQITSALAELKPLLESLPNSNINSAPTVFIPNGSPVTVEQKKEIPKEEGLKKIHTFADDVSMSRAHGYGTYRPEQTPENDGEETTYRSNQDDIIK